MRNPEQITGNKRGWPSRDGQGRGGRKEVGHGREIAAQGPTPLEE